MRSVHFALKFFYENVLNEKFEERLPVTRKENKLPVVLSKGEIKSNDRYNRKYKTQDRFNILILRWFEAQRRPVQITYPHLRWL